MSSMPSRAKRLESAISICLLAILALIGLGILLKQFDSDMSRFGIDTAIAELLTQRNQKETPLGILPPSGFEAFSGARTYTAENLYEKINGKAGFYTDSGFEKLFTQRFISKDTENLSMELYVYDMGNIKNAFSVYSRQKRPEAQLLPNTQFGYETSNALFFVHGRYYIEIVGTSESRELLRAIAETAQKIQEDLSVDKADMAELAFFPQENLISGSVNLYLTDAFGFEGLTDTFTARYQLDDNSLTAFFSKRPNPQDAEAVAESYLAFLVDSGASVKPTTNETLKGNVVDFYGTTEIIFATGTFAAGIHEAENQQAAEKLAEMLAGRLGNLNDLPINE